MNRFVRFVARPEGKPTPRVFELDSAPLRPLEENGFRVRNAWLSMDPALVGRMRGEENYAESVEPGEVMHAYGIGQVIESRHPGVKPGEVRLGRFDMQEYSTQKDPAASTVLNLGLADATAYLSVAGITGATAYFALRDIAPPKEGETVLVSAGGSGVGSVAAQLARRVGCRTVAIVSTDEKVARVLSEFGYDDAVSYRGKSIGELTAALRAACPHGVDVYFDNTAGDISEAVLDLYNDYARIAVIGRLGISHLPDTRNDVGRRDDNNILAKRITKRGMVLLDYMPQMSEAVLRLARWVHSGELRYAVDVLEGIDEVPRAFFRMLAGESTGKQLVRLAPIDDDADPALRWAGKILRAEAFPAGPLISLMRMRTA